MVVYVDPQGQIQRSRALGFRLLVEVFLGGMDVEVALVLADPFGV